MKRIIPILILGFLSKMGMSQDKIESELNKIIYQSGKVENTYIDSLYNAISQNQAEETTTRIDTVLDRFELLTTSKDYEKVSKVYSNGRPIVKSIKNNHTQITYWNQFYDNGQLKWTGYTTGYIWPIGKWEEFDMNGQFVKIIDHESKRINFVNIHKKAIQLNIIKHDLDFYYSEENKTWTIKDWNDQKKYVINENFEIKIENF